MGGSVASRNNRLTCWGNRTWFKAARGSERQRSIRMGGLDEWRPLVKGEGHEVEKSHLDKSKHLIHCQHTSPGELCTFRIDSRHFGIIYLNEDSVAKKTWCKNSNKKRKHTLTIIVLSYVTCLWLTCFIMQLKHNCIRPKFVDLAVLLANQKFYRHSITNLTQKRCVDLQFDTKEMIFLNVASVTVWIIFYLFSHLFQSVEVKKKWDLFVLQR